VPAGVTSLSWSGQRQTNVAGGPIKRHHRILAPNTSVTYTLLPHRSLGHRQITNTVTVTAAKRHNRGQQQLDRPTDTLTTLASAFPTWGTHGPELILASMRWPRMPVPRSPAAAWARSAGRLNQLS